MDLDVLDRRSAKQANLTFAAVLDVICQWADEHQGGLVIIDTLAIWAEVENENDASQTTKAVAAVSAVAQATDCAIVLVHHARKSGGDDGDAVRGSGAILATVDISAELSRVRSGEDARHLDLMGRVILPQHYRLTFKRNTQAYAMESDRGDDVLARIESDLMLVPSHGPGLSRDELHALWKRDPRRRAEELVNKGRMRSEYVHIGRTWLWRYWSLPAAWARPDV